MNVKGTCPKKAYDSAEPQRRAQRPEQRRVQRPEQRRVQSEGKIVRLDEHPISRGHIKTNSDGDSLEIKRQRRQSAQRKAQAKHDRKVRAWANRGLGAILAASMIFGGSAIGDKLTAPHNNYNAQGHNVVEVAEWADVDYRAILLANGIKVNEMEDPLEDIILPEVYSSFGDKISELEEKLDSDKLSAEKREEIETELEGLKAKQQAQDELATVYVDEDGKYAYIIPNGHCSAEKLKDAFGIKDGVLKQYNNLSYVWATDDPEYGYYKDYTGASIPEKGVKVPYDELNKAD